VRSADGRFELALPTGALPAPLQVVIETQLVPHTTPPDRWRLVGDTYRISASGGDELARPAWITFELALDATGRPRTGHKLRHPTIMHLDENGVWEPLQKQTADERHVAARVDRLGSVALMEATSRR